MAMMAATLSFPSCSDFSDYNEVNQDANTNANLTLWENLQQNPQLSDFAQIVKKVGFDQELNTSRFYTVWAPLNGTYDAAALLAQDNETLLHQFVKNHIAEYNHAATGTLSERIHMLNEKSYNFTGNGNYVFDGVNVSQPNLPSSNGVIHVLDGQAVFYPNVYEFFSLCDGMELDSIQRLVKKYEYTTLDASRSVVGPIVDGRQTYIDSVMTTYNTLTSQTLRASLDDEDSTYTMLLPNNEAWRRATEKIGSHYNYISNLKAKYYEQNQNTGAYTEKEHTVTAFNTTYLKDSLVNRALVRNLIYSNNDFYNKWIENESASGDTIRSTTRNKFSNPRDILAATSRKVQMSNGWGRIVDSLVFHPWETYAPTISVAGTNYKYKNQCNIDNFYVTNPDPSLVNLTTQGGNISRLSWAEASPVLERTSRPELRYYLDNVLSGTYNIYCVMVPMIDYNEDGLAIASTSEENKPYMIYFDMNYCNEKGVIQTVKFGDKVNDPTRVDTVYVGTHTFPVCYYALDDFAPVLNLSTSYTRVKDPELWENYSRHYRIAAVMLRPVEQDAFLGKEY